MSTNVFYRELARLEEAAKEHKSANIGESRTDALTKVRRFVNREKRNIIVLK